jgi:hypothetical protein
VCPIVLDETMRRTRFLHVPKHYRCRDNCFSVIARLSATQDIPGVALFVSLRTPSSRVGHALPTACGSVPLAPLAHCVVTLM